MAAAAAQRPALNASLCVALSSQQHPVSSPPEALITCLPSLAAPGPGGCARCSVRPQSSEARGGVNAGGRRTERRSALHVHVPLRDARPLARPPRGAFLWAGRSNEGPVPVIRSNMSPFFPSGSGSSS